MIHGKNCSVASSVDGFRLLPRSVMVVVVVKSGNNKTHIQL